MIVESEAVRDELVVFGGWVYMTGASVRTAVRRRRLGRKIVRTFNCKHYAKGYPVIYLVLLPLNGRDNIWIMGGQSRSNEQPQQSRFSVNLMDEQVLAKSMLSEADRTKAGDHAREQGTPGRGCIRNVPGWLEKE